MTTHSLLRERMDHLEKKVLYIQRSILNSFGVIVVLNFTIVLQQGNTGFLLTPIVSQPKFFV